MSKRNNKLYGAILGDLAGQPYEFKYKGDYTEFNLHDNRSHFTDDTLMTLATAYAIINDISFEESYKFIGNKYEGDYYGAGFKAWLKTPLGTINNSYANGCLMRISPLMYMENHYPEDIIQYKLAESCLCSHSHHHSIITTIHLYDLYINTNRYPGVYQTELYPFTKFEVGADKTFKFIYHAYISKHATSTQKLIKKVVKCGGDTDTNASIIGELMNYKCNDLTQQDIEYVESKLDPFLLDILHQFNKEF